MSNEVKTVGAFEAKTHLSRLLDAVECGERVVITRHGKPVAELSPPPKEKKRAKFGCAKGEGFYMAPDFDAPLEDFKDYM
jgi:prevent-host-death family protein